MCISFKEPKCRLREKAKNNRINSTTTSTLPSFNDSLDEKNKIVEKIRTQNN
jgi:hypothetical protein